MQDLRFVLSPYICKQDIPIPAQYVFCTIEFLCMQVEQNIQNVNILLTNSDNRNDNKTLTFMDGGPSNCRRGPDLTACLVGLRSQRSHIGVIARQGRVLSMQDLQFVLSPYICMQVIYTNSFSICFFVNTYDTVHILLIKIHIVFTIAYNTY